MEERVENTRVAAVKRHLAKPPTAAHFLVLSAATSANEQTTVQLGRWPREDVAPHLAEEICTLVQEHSEATQSTVMCSLYYLDKYNEQVGGNKVLRYSPQTPASINDSLASLPSQLTGDSQSQAAQAQRHLEAVMRFQLQSTHMVLSQMRLLSDHTMDLCTTLADRLAESESRERKATEKAEELQATVEEIVSAGGDETSEAQNKLMRVLEPMIPALIQKFMLGSGGQTPPQTGDGQ